MFIGAGRLKIVLLLLEKLDERPSTDNVDKAYNIDNSFAAICPSPEDTTQCATYPIVRRLLATHLHIINDVVATIERHLL